MKDQLQHLIYRLLDPVVRRLLRVGITPNHVTFLGFLLNVVAAAIFIVGGEAGLRGDFSYVGWGGATILFAGLFDMLDGRLARVGGLSSRYGALFDSVLDRYSELFMFFGICWYLISHGYVLSALFGFLALIGSMMVSYVRARAEGLGIACAVGLMQRPERIVLIGGAALLCGVLAPLFPPYWVVGNGSLTTPFRLDASLLFSVPLALVAVLANYTAVVRLNHCRALLDKPTTTTPLAPKPHEQSAAAATHRV